MAKITVQNKEITVVSANDSDYISLTDIARHKSDEPTAVIGNWMRNRNTIEYLAFGKLCTIPVLNPSNSRGLEKRQD